MKLKTERLILRTIQLSDAEDIFEYSKNPNVGLDAGWKPHESIEETIEVIKDVFLGKEEIFGIVYNDKMIGFVGFMDDPKRKNDKTKMLGYALAEEYWGQGFMTEAATLIVNLGFDLMNLNLISTYCYPSNSRSKSVIKKLGFEYEGTLRLCEILYNGNVYDNECYSLINED